MAHDDRPSVRIGTACRDLGNTEVIRRCVAIFDGDMRDGQFIVLLGGTHATALLAQGIPEDQAYWFRVWAMRGLLWAGVDDSTDALGRALRDDAWRVREMACKVIARHLAGDFVEDVARLQSDPVRRVRTTAQRALERLVRAAA